MEMGTSEEIYQNKVPPMDLYPFLNYCEEYYCETYSRRSVPSHTILYNVKVIWANPLFQKYILSNW